MKKDRLGRGLGALLGEYLEEQPGLEDGQVSRIPLASILANPYQPRTDFAEEELEELARSIKENGLLQPLVVRSGGGGRYELVAGERRMRALRRLGWTEAPAMVRDVDDRTLLVLALVENLQREELNPLDEAMGYRQLTDEFGLTQGEIAEAVGKDRSTVANMLRLLRLPPSVRKLLESGTLSMGHARALLAVDDAVRAGELARTASKEGWSVRQIEKRVRQLSAAEVEVDRSRQMVDPSQAIPDALEEELRRVLGTRVKIRWARRGGGAIEIPFGGHEDFERVFALVAGREASEILN